VCRNSYSAPSGKGKQFEVRWFVGFMEFVGGYEFEVRWFKVGRFVGFVEFMEFVGAA